MARMSSASSGEVAAAVCSLSNAPPSIGASRSCRAPSPGHRWRAHAHGASLNTVPRCKAAAPSRPSPSARPGHTPGRARRRPHPVPDAVAGEVPQEGQVVQAQVHGAERLGVQVERVLDAERLNLQVAQPRRATERRRGPGTQAVARGLPGVCAALVGGAGVAERRRGAVRCVRIVQAQRRRHRSAEPRQQARRVAVGPGCRGGLGWQQRRRRRRPLQRGLLMQRSDLCGVLRGPGVAGRRGAPASQVGPAALAQHWRQQVLAVWQPGGACGGQAVGARRVAVTQFAGQAPRTRARRAREAPCGQVARQCAGGGRGGGARGRERPAHPRLAQEAVQPHAARIAQRLRAAPLGAPLGRLGHAAPRARLARARPPARRRADGRVHSYHGLSVLWIPALAPEDSQPPDWPGSAPAGGGALWALGRQVAPDRAPRAAHRSRGATRSRQPRRSRARQHTPPPNRRRTRRASHSAPWPQQRQARPARSALHALGAGWHPGGLLRRLPASCARPAAGDPGWLSDRWFRPTNMHPRSPHSDDLHAD